MFWKSYKDECRYDEPLLLIINIIAGSMKKNKKTLKQLLFLLCAFLENTLNTYADSKLTIYAGTGSVEMELEI